MLLLYYTNLLLMNKNLRIRFALTISLIVLITGLSSFINSEKNIQAETTGELTFTVRTVTANGNYSPKHVLAIWIEDANGFVKTRKAMANQRKQYLYTWYAASNYNEVDAITGSTLTSHQTHTISWDCKDLNGDLVPDGDYTVYVEFTDKHAQGPLYSIVFTKGPNAQTYTPADETNFKDLELIYEPLVSSFTYVSNELEVTFTNNSVGADSYEWNFGDGSTSTDENPVYTYSTTGTYTVALTATAGSNSTSYEEEIVITSTDISNIIPAKAITHWPNPTDGNITIALANSNKLAHVNIYSGEGRLIESISSMEKVILLNLSNEPSGMYFINVVTGKRTYSTKLIRN